MTDEELKKRIDKFFWVNAEKGILTRKVTVGNQKAGTEAGCVDKMRSGDRVRVAIDGKKHFRSRLIFLWVHGYLPEVVDHENGNAMDDSIQNLRGTDNQGNQRNAKLLSTNTSGVVGVGWNKNANKWAAGIAVDRRLIHLGYFDDKDDAIQARKQAEVKYGFHENHGRK
ncbi:HNH endonuclease [Vibrio chagasii]|uniref:HNH endonuclease n=1 Tax=Vibrio chagasii TaxID=170679 RepID=UPI003DA0C7E1